MPKFAVSPDEYKGRFRHVSLNTVYFNMLYEICHEYIGIESISQCLYMIIKDLYDTLTMTRSGGGSAEERKKQEARQHKRKRSEEEGMTIPVRPPPPP